MIVPLILGSYVLFFFFLLSCFFLIEGYALLFLFSEES